MSFKTKKLILVLVGIAFVVALLLFRSFLLETTIGNGIFVLVLIGFVTLNLIWWRCKKCGRYLGKLSILANHCPFCGEELE